MAGLGGILAKAVQVSGYLLWEKLARPRVTRASEVPGLPDAITAQWMTEVLCRDRPGVEVVAVESTDGSAGSTVRRRFHLTYNDAGRRLVEQEADRRGGLPASVFAKMTATLTSRLAYSGGAMADEALFFNEIRRELDLEAPWGYFASYDFRTCRSIQLMEDLVATRGATFGTPETRIDRSQAEDVVTTLATLHAKFAADPRLDGRFSILRTVPQWYRSAEPFRLDKYHAQAMDKAKDVIPPRLYARRGETWGAFMKSVRLHDELPRTLLHSDVHLGNWYITSAGRMGLCDWGCVMKGNWSRDFAYAVSGTLTVENRRLWERDLLELYLDRVAAGGGPRLSLDEGWLRYRQQLFQGLLMWTPTLCHSPLLPDMQPEHVALEMIRRTATAIDDHQSLECLD